MRNFGSDGILKIVTGGQTGTDRAVMDFALSHGFPLGGWCPRGRLAEDGIIPSRYPLQETPSEDVSQRTEWNARDSDATLILTYGPPLGGTKWTIECAKRHRRPFLCSPLDNPPEFLTQRQQLFHWFSNHPIKILNIAGPRESLAPGKVYALSTRYLEEVLLSILREVPPQGRDR